MIIHVTICGIHLSRGGTLKRQFNTQEDQEGEHRQTGRIHAAAPIESRILGTGRGPSPKLSRACPSVVRFLRTPSRRLHGLTRPSLDAIPRIRSAPIPAKRLETCRRFAPRSEQNWACPILFLCSPHVLLWTLCPAFARRPFRQSAFETCRRFAPRSEQNWAFPILFLHSPRPSLEPHSGFPMFTPVYRIPPPGFMER